MPKMTEAEKRRKELEKKEAERRARKLLGSGSAGRAADALLARRNKLRDI